MTGFGRASVEAGERRLRVEIRSVNHRGLDLKIRGAEADATCGVEIGRAVRTVVERGAITVLVRDESADASSTSTEVWLRAGKTGRVSPARLTESAPPLASTSTKETSWQPITGSARLPLTVA